MASKSQMTGMLGVYLAAAELSRQGLIVSPTSRSARGADLLVTDQECRKAWSVQVKTNAKPTNFWLVGARAADLKSDSHIYIFVSIRGNDRPEYIVVPSNHVAEKVREKPAKTSSIWYEFHRADRYSEGEGWEVFQTETLSVLGNTVGASISNSDIISSVPQEIADSVKVLAGLIRDLSLWTTDGWRRREIILEQIDGHPRVGNSIDLVDVAGEQYRNIPLIKGANRKNYVCLGKPGKLKTWFIRRYPIGIAKVEKVYFAHTDRPNEYRIYSESEWKLHGI